MNLGCGNGSKGCLMDKRGGMGHRGKGDGGLGEGVEGLLPGQRGALWTEGQVWVTGKKGMGVWGRGRWLGSCCLGKGSQAQVFNQAVKQGLQTSCCCHNDNPRTVIIIGIVLETLQDSDQAM